MLLTLQNNHFLHLFWNQIDYDPLHCLFLKPFLVQPAEVVVADVAEVESLLVRAVHSPFHVIILSWANIL